MNDHHQLATAAAAYQLIRDRIRAVEADVDEETLADTVEGLTNLHEVLAIVVRSALLDDALAEGLKGHIALLQTRLTRFGERAEGKRRIARDVMAELGIHKVQAPDFTLSLRMGQPGLVVTDEGEIPKDYFEPRPPKLDRMGLIADLKRGTEVGGAMLSNPEPVLSVRIR